MKVLFITLWCFFVVSLNADELERINAIVQEIQSLRVEQKTAQNALKKCNKKLVKEKAQLIKNLESQLESLKMKKKFNQFPKLKMKSNIE